MSPPPPTLPPLAATVLLASGAAVLLSVLVGIALLRWRRTVRWHGTIIAVLVVATAAVFALILNVLWKAPFVELRVTTEPIVSGVAMLIVLLILTLASKRFGGLYQTTWKEALRAAGGALLMLILTAASLVFFLLGGFILIFLVGWPGLLVRFSIWPDGYEELDAFVIMLSVELTVWFVIFLDCQRSLQHHRRAQI